MNPRLDRNLNLEVNIQPQRDGITPLLLRLRLRLLHWNLLLLLLWADLIPLLPFPLPSLRPGDLPVPPHRTIDLVVGGLPSPARLRFRGLGGLLAVGYGRWRALG